MLGIGYVRHSVTCFCFLTRAASVAWLASTTAVVVRNGPSDLPPMLTWDTMNQRIVAPFRLVVFPCPILQRATTSISTLAVSKVVAMFDTTFVAIVARIVRLVNF